MMPNKTMTWSEKAGSSSWPSTTQMLLDGETSEEAPNDCPWGGKIGRWYIDGGRRSLVAATFVLMHTMIYASGFRKYYVQGNLSTARSTFGITYPIASAAALVLQFDVAILILPCCRTLILLVRQTPLRSVILFDFSTSFHKLLAWSIVVFAWVHTTAHWYNFAQLSFKHSRGFKGILQANFGTGPGLSGHMMLAALMLMMVTSLEKARHANFERFWYIHHAFIVLFLLWSFHGAFCMIKTDTPSTCMESGGFWKYWTFGGVIYLIERVLREVRGTHKTFISKVIQHPSNVVEIQIKKEHTRTRAGQVRDTLAHRY